MTPALILVTLVLILVVAAFGLVKTLISFIFPWFNYIVIGAMVIGWPIMLYVVMSAAFKDGTPYEPGFETWLRNAGFFIVLSAAYWGFALASWLILRPVNMLTAMLKMVKK